MGTLEGDVAEQDLPNFSSGFVDQKERPMTMAWRHILIASLLLVPLNGQAVVTCTATGKVEGEACDVSMVQLLADGKSFDGRHVRVVGYLAGSARGDILFISSDSARSSDLASGVLIVPSKREIRQRIAALDGQLVRVLGCFKDESTTLPANLTVPASIVDVIEIVPARVPWGFDPVID